MTESNVRMLLVDESVFRIDPRDDAHNARVAQFLNDAKDTFAIFYATREKPIRKAVQKMERAGIFQLVDGNIFNISDWDTFKDIGVDVFISDRLDTEIPVRAACIESTSIAYVPKAFSSFMKLHREEIESDPPKITITEALAQLGVGAGMSDDENMQKEFASDIAQLKSTYPDLQSVLDKIKKSRPVKRLLDEFNKHADGDTSLKDALFCYFTTLSFNEPDRAEKLVNDKNSINAVIHFFEAAACQELINPALNAIEKIVAKEPRRGDDEIYLTM